MVRSADYWTVIWNNPCNDRADKLRNRRDPGSRRWRLSVCRCRCYCRAWRRPATWLAASRTAGPSSCVRRGCLPASWGTMGMRITTTRPALRRMCRSTVTAPWAVCWTQQQAWRFRRTAPVSRFLSRHPFYTRRLWCRNRFLPIPHEHRPPGPEHQQSVCGTGAFGRA